MADDVAPLGHREALTSPRVRRKPLEFLGKGGSEGGTEYEKAETSEGALEVIWTWTTRGGEKWSRSECIWTVKPVGLADGPDVAGRENKKQGWHQGFCLEQLEEQSCSLVLLWGKLQEWFRGKYGEFGFVSECHKVVNLGRWLFQWNEWHTHVGISLSRAVAGPVWLPKSWLQ